jgi:hypothetical protein
MGGAARRSTLGFSLLLADATNQEGIRTAMDTPRGRRRLRLRLRAILLLVAVVGLGLGWLANKIYCQRKAVALIEANGGWVVYDWCGYDGVKRDPPGPRWLRRIVGDELFQEIDHVCLEDHQPKRAHSPLEHVLEWTVRGAPRINTLWIANAPMNEPAYHAIGKLTSLADLTLVGDAPTDAEVSFLAHLSSLESLQILDGHRLTNRALESLGRLPKLEVLNISDLNLTDRSLELLSRCKRLKDLSVDAERYDISAVGLRHVRAMRSLEPVHIQLGGWSIHTAGSRFSEPTPTEAIDKAIAESVER